jgi:hypothetical protein
LEAKHLAASESNWNLRLQIKDPKTSNGFLGKMCKNYASISWHKNRINAIDKNMIESSGYNLGKKDQP